MIKFPYSEIFRKSLSITGNNFWLWIFGLFMGGLVGLDPGGMAWKENRHWPGVWNAAVSWVAAHPLIFSVLLLGALVALFLFLALQVLSRGAFIWAVGEIDQPGLRRIVPSFWTAIKQSRLFFWRVIGVELSVILILFFFSIFFAFPVVYLFAAGHLTRAFILLTVSVLIFIPLAAILAFFHMLGPAIIVLYDLRIGEAFRIAISLLRSKFWQLILTALLLLVANFIALLLILLGLVAIGLFALILFSFSSYFGLPIVAYIWAVGTVLIALIYVILLKAGFSVFLNSVWVLTIREMMKTVNLQKESYSPAALEEPAI